jgi:uncharacterized protein (DUF983 family)
MEVNAVNERFDMVELLKDLQSGKQVTCPKCKRGQLTPVGDAETTHTFCCAECNVRVNID